MSIVGGSLKTKNVFASDCFTVIIVHCDIEELENYFFFSLVRTVCPDSAAGTTKKSFKLNA